MKESEIRPAAVFERYLELSRCDIQTFFSDHASFEEIACPACGAAERARAFVKLGFSYQLCSACGSMYLSPRPSVKMQSDYAQNSEAVRYWSTNFYRETAEVRRVKMFRPRAELVGDLVREGVIAEAGVIVDIGSGYGIFLEELRQLGVFHSIAGVEPAPGLAEVCRSKGFEVIEKFVEDVADGELLADATTAFEVLEHVFDPVEFLRGCCRTLKPGGVLLLTTLTVSGFDLQVLWERSNSIYPPHHINLLSLDGLRTLVQRIGFEVVSITTPGKLDVDIVSNAVKSDSSLDVPRFVRSIAGAPEKVRDEFQEFLQRASLSSHVRVIARRL